MKKFINPLLRLGTAIALLSVIYMQNNEIKELKEKAPAMRGNIQTIQTIDSLETMIDSVSAENLPLQIQLGRYEIALELLKEKNKKAAEEFELILTTQTE
jgi:hypothetical protein